jgi:hypothetical protein
MGARIVGDELTVTGPLGPRTFRMADVRAVEVEYYDKEKAYKIPGGTLLGVGSPFLLTGVVFTTAAVMADSGYGQGLAFVFGLVSTGVGLSFAIPGIVLISLDPKPPGAPTASVRPKIQVGPSGLHFSTAF